MSFFVAVLVAAMSGYIALSYEIVWYRAYAFVSQASPAAFGLLLGAYLLGIALGSYVSGIFCKDSTGAFSPASLRPIAFFVLVANLVSLLVVPGLAYYAVTTYAWKGGLWGVGLASGLLGATFPLTAHFGIEPDERAGQRLSQLYVANILGSVAGSLVTGFWLFDILTIGGVTAAMAVLGVMLAAALYLSSKPSRVGAAVAVLGAVVLSSGVVRAQKPLHDLVYERLLWGMDQPKYGRFAELVENRHGVIAVGQDGTVYGGGAYDGKFNTSLMHDRNFVVRGYAVAAMHPSPKQVLMIGLASGSWAQVVANMPSLDELTIIEINPGYLELIEKHPEVRTLLKHPKVKIVIDDGRRWLMRHPDRTFDFIVMNTTFHYRAHATNLLSKEFLEHARTHLAGSGVLYYNTTSSGDVFKTGITVFPHALRVMNLLAVSDSPIVLDKTRWEPALRAWRIDGQPVLDGSPAAEKRLLEILSLADTLDKPVGEDGLESRDSMLKSFANDRVITDDNMMSEWWSPHAPH